MLAIHICGLKNVESLAAEIKPSHVLSLLGGITPFPPTPAGIDPKNHLKILVADIAEHQEGMISPGAEHAQEIIAFGHHWATHNDGAQPILVHCFAGISRSTASALMIACALRPEIEETMFAQELRRASASAQPNPLLVSHADAQLARNGNLIAAVAAMGEADFSKAGTPFVLRVG